jgi:protein-arginine deiminase
MLSFVFITTTALALSQAQPADASKQTSAKGSLQVLIDTSGDHIPDTDVRRAGKRKFAGGMYHGVVLHNADDDNGDKQIDDTDERVNGSQDVLDLYPVKINVQGLNDDMDIHIHITNAPKTALRLFHQQKDASFSSLDISNVLSMPVSTLKEAPMLFIEGRDFASEQWNGEFSVSVKVANGKANAESVELALRIAPWLMLSNASEAQELYVRQYTGRNDKMLEQLKVLLPQANTKLHIIPADADFESSNIWLQDTLEIGRQYTPFRSMPVVLQANRNKDIDRFSSDTLLGPDFGWMQVGDYRDKYAKGIEGVGWMDWFGNLEVSPPLPSHPHGRMYYGEAGAGNQLDARIVSKIAAQGRQTPFALDVSYLMIKHADETLSWVPGTDGRWYALVPSPAEMLKLAKQIQQSGHGDLPMLIPFEEEYTINTLLSDNEGIAHNQSIEAGALTKNIDILKQELGISDDQFIKVPAWYKADGTSLIPNMVNSALVNGMFIAPDPNGPVVGGTDLIQQAFVQQMAQSSVTIAFVDDQLYHRWWGNVHCATNVKRRGSEHIEGLLH